MNTIHKYQLTVAFFRRLFAAEASPAAAAAAALKRVKMFVFVDEENAIAIARTAASNTRHRFRLVFEFNFPNQMENVKEIIKTSRDGVRSEIGHKVVTISVPNAQTTITKF